jgi:hypothetical protein
MPIKTTAEQLNVHQCSIRFFEGWFECLSGKGTVNDFALQQKTVGGTGHNKKINLFIRNIHTKTTQPPTQPKHLKHRGQ